MQKVLILTYYWPPSGGAGVQRWLKFVKYMRDFGFEPVVYTAENGEIPVIDNSLQKDIPEGVEILKSKIWEPYDVYKKFIGRKKSDKIKEKKEKSLKYFLLLKDLLLKEVILVLFFLSLMDLLHSIKKLSLLVQ